MASKIEDWQATSLGALAPADRPDDWEDPVPADSRAQADIIAKELYGYLHVAHRGNESNLAKLLKTPWEELSAIDKRIYHDAIVCLLNFKEAELTTALGEFPI